MVAYRRPPFRGKIICLKILTYQNFFTEKYLAILLCKLLTLVPNKGQPMIFSRALISFFLKTIFLFFVSGLSSFLFAQEASESTPNYSDLSLADLFDLRMITLPSGAAKPVNLAPSVASVITAADIKTMGARNFEDVLETIPGIHISRSGQVYSPRILVRGVSSFFNPHVLVMVNGNPITSAFRGDRSTTLGVLPVASIERIEIIRGPGSALYGAEAMAGVINVITKNGADIKGTVAGARAGSFNSYEGWAQTGYANDEIKVAVMANFFSTEGQKEIVTQDARRGFATNAPGPVSVGGQVTDLIFDFQRGHWRFFTLYRDLDNQGNGVGTANSLDPDSRLGYSRALVNLTYNNPNFAPNWEAETRLTYFYDDQEIQTKGALLFPPGTNLGGGVFPEGMIGKPEYKERALYFDTSAAYRGFDSHIWRFGAGARRSDLYEVRNSRNSTSTLPFSPRGDYVDVTDTDEIYSPEVAQDGHHVFMQDEWKMNSDWELTIGARFDHFPHIADTFNPRGALVWQTNPKLTSKFLYGRAFRSPAFAELYAKNNPATTGNPNLKPETNDVYELAFSHATTDSLRLGLNLYHYQLRGLIDFIQDPGPTKTAQNAANQTGDGLELEFQYKASPILSYIGNYSYVKTREEASGKQAGEYPNHQAYLRQDWTVVDDFSLNTEVKYVGERPRTPRDTRANLAGFTTLDIIARADHVFSDWSFALAARNLFDTKVFEPSSGPASGSTFVPIPNDFPQEGRSVWGEISYVF